jgi:membrane peptidoglycan carboxypeptidase
MPNLADIVHRRREARAEKRRRTGAPFKMAGLGLGYVFSILLAAGIFAFVLAYADLTRDLPSIDELPILLDSRDGLLLQPTRLLDRNATGVIYTFEAPGAARLYVPLASLPQSLLDAVIAADDNGFETHAGYVFSGLDNPDLHPTLAQKLAHDLLLYAEPASLRRALRERILAGQITSRFGRDQVLEWYVNSANFGNDAYGIESASELYFGKPAGKLNLAEAAMLAAIPATPSLNPFDAPHAAAQRATELVLVMQALEMIEQVPSAPAVPVAPPASQPEMDAFANLVMTQLSSRFDRQRLERGGLNIITTLEMQLQQDALCLSRIYVQRLSGAQGDEGFCEAARSLAALPQGNFAQLFTSAIILDPRAGQILALTGEMGPAGESTYLGTHAPGSLLTPFIYLAGFARGLGPGSLVWDIPPEGQQNSDLTFHGPVRLRIALANDFLTPALDVLEQMGSGNVAQVARSFGLEINAGADLLEDSTPQSMPDLAAAYAVFAASGIRNGQNIDESIQPSSVLRVETTDGRTWLDWSQPESQSVVSTQLAYLMNHVLSDSPSRWVTWGNPNGTDLERPAAFKAGWTGGADAWSIGYTPSRLVAVWTGSSATPAGESQGGPALPVRLPAALWSALMQTASAALPADGWSPPAGITEMEVCDPSGLLPSPDCPNIVREVFMNGFEPTHEDNLFHTYIINRETGLLATVFTPPDLVEKQVFMSVPETARKWAAESGIQVEPVTYDAIQPGSPNPNVNVSSPALFANVSGKVQLIGTATGNGFKYYRILVGQGLYPAGWTQVGNDFSNPVINGPLAEWDTTGLSGLYAVQLEVVYSDQRVETAVILVMIGE